MHRDHRYVQRRLPEAVDGELSPRERARVARHVDECPECGPMLRGLIGVRAALRAIREPEEPDGASVVPGVLERLRRESDLEPPSAPGRARPA